MEPRRSRFTSLPSRAYAIIGVLGVLWLVIAGLLVIQLDHGLFGESDTASGTNEAAATAVRAAPLPPDSRSTYRNDDAPGRAEAPRRPGGASSGNEQIAPPDERGLERRENDVTGELDGGLQPADNGGQLSVYAELNGLLIDIHDHLDGHDSRLDPEQRIHAIYLAARLNSDGRMYVVHFRDPSIETARRRAVRAHAILVEAGLHPWLVETFGERGTTGLAIALAG